MGLETGGALAGGGATVVLACRNLDKAAAARGQIEAGAPRGRVELLGLDLADQGQIAVAADEALERFPRLHGLINHAGVMGLPWSRTVDGHEVVFGPTHLGHFAPAGRNIPALPQDTKRVVTGKTVTVRVNLG